MITVTRIDRLARRAKSNRDTKIARIVRLPEDLQWMHDNVRLVRGTQSEVQGTVSSLRRVPHVRTPEQAVMPRVLAIAQDFLHTVSYRYSDHAVLPGLDRPHGRELE